MTTVTFYVDMEDRKELKAPNNCTIIRDKKCIIDKNGIKIEEVDRCFPELCKNQLRIYQSGSNFIMRLTPVGIAQGVSTKEIHDFNVESGWINDLDIDADDMAKEAVRTSISRSKRIVRELVASNPWDFFVTITLDPRKWDRYSGKGLQETISRLSHKWRYMQRNGQRPYKGYRYIMVPEPHQDGAIHLHGVVRYMPEEYLKRYTVDDIGAARPLPQYIKDCISEGKEIWHCSVWDELFGYNTIEPIKDVDRISTYITKYITKDLGTLPIRHKIWHSRGLQRAKLVAKYDTSSNMDESVDILDLMKSVAILLPSGKRLYNEYRTSVCSMDRTHVYESLRCVTSTVDGNEIPIEHLLAQLDKMFPNGQMPIVKE